MFEDLKNNKKYYRTKTLILINVSAMPNQEKEVIIFL